MLLATRERPLLVTGAKWRYARAAVASRRWPELIINNTGLEELFRSNYIGSFQFTYCVNYPSKQLQFIRIEKCRNSEVTYNRTSSLWEWKNSANKEQRPNLFPYQRTQEIHVHTKSRKRKPPRGANPVMSTSIALNKSVCQQVHVYVSSTLLWLQASSRSDKWWGRVILSLGVWPLAVSSE